VGAIPGSLIALAMVPVTFVARQLFRRWKMRDVTAVTVIGAGISLLISLLSLTLAPAFSVSFSELYPDIIWLSIANIIATGLGAWLMRLQNENAALHESLVANRERYLHLFEYAPVPLWEEDFSELARFVRQNREMIVPANAADLLDRSWELFSRIRILGVNRAAVRFAGARSKEELLSRLPETATEDFANAVVQELFTIRNNRTFFMTSTAIRNLQGEKQYVVIQWSVLPGAESDYSRVLVSVIDTTTVIRQAKDLRENLERKQDLIKEIHHRVRNSLSLAYSILGLQIDDDTDPRLVEILRGSMNRIQAIALIHTRLYQNREILAMNIQTYIQDLIEVLSTQTDASSVAVELEAPSEVMHIDQILSLGIILNELVTNTLKHAFPPGHRGDRKIRISLRREESMMRFEYADNGVGLDDDAFQSGGEGSLGTNLLISISQQLGGEIRSVRNGEWSRVRIDFPLKAIE
jgi:two-component sensor histidine kinase/PAS domain-containing protein